MACLSVFVQELVLTKCFVLDKRHAMNADTEYNSTFDFMHHSASQVFLSVSQPFRTKADAALKLIINLTGLGVSCCELYSSPRSHWYPNAKRQEKTTQTVKKLSQFQLLR